VIIYHLPEDAIVVSLDGFPLMDDFLVPEDGIRRRPDFVIESAKEQVLIIIEMKRSQGGTAGEIIEQLRGGAAICAYCMELARRGEINYGWRYAALTNTGPKKGKTQIRPDVPLNDRPKDFYRISPHNGKISYRSLKGAHLGKA
jgi:hypothetical protein